MRPLAVLILVLGAVAALLFAMTTMTSSSGRETTVEAPGTPEVRAAAPDRAETMDSIVAPQQPLDERAAEPSRSVVDIGEEGVTTRYRNWIEGTVLDPEGTPVAGAQIALVEQGAPSRFADLMRVMNAADAPSPHRQATTDLSGRFRFETLRPGAHWTVAVTHDEYSRREVGPINVPEQGGATADVQLEPGYRLFGYVRDHLSGQAVMGATITLENPALMYLPAARRAGSDQLSAVTDADGYYVIANINPGQRALVCSSPGYGSQIKYNVTFLGEGKKEMAEDFHLKPAKLIAGRVIGPDRTGIEGVTIDAISNSHEPGSRGTGISITDGEFVIADIDEGLYTLRVTAEGYDVEPVLRIEAGQSDLEIQLFEQGTVMGKVVDATTGRPLSEFTCRVRQVHKTNKAWGHEVTRGNFSGRKDGSFELGGVSQGTFVVQADARGYASSFSDSFTISQGMTTPDVVVRMTRGGTLKGRVVDSATGEPVARAQVTTNDNNFIQSEFTAFLQGLSPSALTRSKVTTDDDGRFELELITPETYQISVSAEGFTQVVLNDVRIGDGLTTDLGRVELSKGASVTGIVYGSDGRPAAGYTVTMSRVDNKVWGNLQGRTDAQGQFLIANAAPGSYKLSAARPRDGATNPFETIIDMKNSEVEVTIVDGQELAQDLFLARE